MTAPHIFYRAEPIPTTRAAMLMLHGRGASAADILSLADEFGVRKVAYLAPQADGGQWYPNRFVAPVASNEPWLSAALKLVDDIVSGLARDGIPIERTFLLGFSQGACLALEYAARNPAPFGGVIGLSGALIENGDQPRNYAGRLTGARVFLGCSDRDPHIPLARVRRSAEVFEQLGATVTARIYPNMGHVVVADEIEFVRSALLSVAERSV